MNFYCLVYCLVSCHSGIFHRRRQRIDTIKMLYTALKPNRSQTAILIHYLSEICLRGNVICCDMDFSMGGYIYALRARGS